MSGPKEPFASLGLGGDCGVPRGGADVAGNVFGRFWGLLASGLKASFASLGLGGDRGVSRGGADVAGTVFGRRRGSVAFSDFFPGPLPNSAPASEGLVTGDGIAADEVCGSETNPCVVERLTGASGGHRCADSA